MMFRYGVPVSFSFYRYRYTITIGIDPGYTAGVFSLCSKLVLNFIVSRYGIAFSYYTITIGIDPGYSRENFYDKEDRYILSILCFLKSFFLL
jgi:hypothetical protein